jgi:hypothetical protein
MIRAAHADMQKYLASLTPEQRVAPVLDEGWSVQDSLAHISAWENMTMDRIAIYRHGEKPTAWLEGFVISENDSADQIEKINAHLFEKNKNRALDDVLQDFRAAFQRTVETVEALTEQEIFDPDYFPVRDHHPLLNVIAGDTYAHYDEHLGWMREALGK